MKTLCNSGSVTQDTAKVCFPSQNTETLLCSPALSSPNPVPHITFHCCHPHRPTLFLISYSLIQPHATHALPTALFVLLALAIYTGVTVSFLGRRFGDWRFSWSYILGWVALLMTFFAGTEAE